MTVEREPLADVAFTGEVIEWRGPAPFVFVAVPPEHVGELSYASRTASYGWGVVPVEVTVGAANFTTSLFPRNGGYLLPLKIAIRTQEAICLGDRIQVQIRVFNDGKLQLRCPS